MRRSSSSQIQTFCDYEFIDFDNFHTIAVYGLETNCSGRPYYLIFISEAQAALTFSITLPMNFLGIFDWWVTACSNGNRMYSLLNSRSICPFRLNGPQFCPTSLIGKIRLTQDPACPNTSSVDCYLECSTDVLSRPYECRFQANYSYVYTSLG